MTNVNKFSLHRSAHLFIILIFLLNRANINILLQMIMSSKITYLTNVEKGLR